VGLKLIDLLLNVRFESKGWYDYDKTVGNGRKPLPSREMDTLVRKYAKKGRSAFSEHAIIERVFFPLVNEGFKCLKKGSRGNHPTLT
jgi:hypothetical protein